MYFDNLQVTHTRGPLLEETHYYPFGLTMTGISSKAAGMTANKKKYQQYELNTDFDINLYESFYRSHDPQLGRFWQVDPKPTDFESPYVAMGNNPIRNMDLLGDSITPASRAEINTLAATINTRVTDLTTERNNIISAATNKKGRVKLSKDQRARVDDLNARITELNTSLADINLMIADKTTIFTLNAQDVAIAEITPTADQVRNRRFTLNYVRGDVGNQIHEVAKHGAQIVRGDLNYSIDNAGAVFATVRAGLTNYDLEVAAYRGGHYAFNGFLAGHRDPLPGSQEATLNTFAQTTGTQNQINTPFRITSIGLITTDLIRAMMETPIGNIRIY